MVSGGATLELFTRDIFGHSVKHILLNRETGETVEHKLNELRNALKDRVPNNDDLCMVDLYVKNILIDKELSQSATEFFSTYTPAFISIGYSDSEQVITDTKYTKLNIEYEIFDDVFEEISVENIYVSHSKKLFHEDIKELLWNKTGEKRYIITVRRNLGEGHSKDDFVIRATLNDEVKEMIRKRSAHTKSANKTHCI